MEVIFMFLDEALAPDLDAAWLTGVLVWAEQYSRVRDGMIQASVDVQRKAGIQHPYPMELHAVSLLSDISGATDEHRYEVFTRVVDLVNTEHLVVVSTGYSGATQIREELERTKMPQGDKLYSYNLERILGALRLPQEALLVPVFDGIPGRNKKSKKQQPVDAHAYNTFIGGVHHGHHYRVARGSSAGYLPNFRNIVEPTFSDSARSPLLQLADLVSYLLGVLEPRPGAEPKAFKARVIEIAKTMDMTLVRRIEHTMTYISGTTPP